jgi:hypothetical protein
MATRCDRAAASVQSRGGFQTTQALVATPFTARYAVSFRPALICVLADGPVPDTVLANACLDYLNYDRLAVCDLDKHLEGGGRERGSDSPGTNCGQRPCGLPVN